MNRKETSKIAEMAATLTGDAKMPERIAEQERATRMISALTAARARKGMTQKQVAQSMKVSVSTVSRLEDSADADVRFGDIIAYAKAVGVNVSMLMEESDIPTAARIKNCLLLVSEGLQHLSKLAANSQGDREMIDGINRFRGEVLYNFLIRYMESGVAMPRITFTQQAEKVAVTRKKPQSANERVRA